MEIIEDYYKDINDKCYSIETCYKNLCLAIIQQACKDYVNAKIYGNNKELENIKKFFRSNWFIDLSVGLDGETLIKKLDSIDKIDKYMLL